MYRDVKKKLLSVALCICMVIGAVQIVPKAQAAATKQVTVVGTYGVQQTPANFTIELVSPTLIYNGQSQLPEISKVTCDNSDFRGTVSISGVGGVDAGTYTCNIVSDGWTFPDNCISYEIKKASISSISADVKQDLKVQKYTGNIVTPAAEDIVVKADVNGVFGQEIDPSQYTVTGEQSTCGLATCKITINSKNYTGSLEKDGISYVIAYDMGSSVGYKASISATSIPYSSDMTLPVITLVGDKTINVNNSPTVFSVKYYKDGSSTPTTVNSVGTYTVKVTPANNAAYCMYHDDKATPNYVYFTGEYSAQFTVTALSVSDLKVTATDPLTNQPLVISDSKNRLVVSYEAGKRAEPTVIVEAGSKDITADCSITYPDADKAGQARMIITPDASKTNYTGSLTIYYYIRSDIEITNYRFSGLSAKVNKIVYDAQDHQLDECEVKNAAGTILTSGLDYTLTYQYWNGSSYQDATEADRKTVGKKRIHIVGQNTYEGRDAYQEYEILPVDISEGGIYWKNVSVEFKGAPYTYTGQEITPSFTMKYNGIEVGTDENTNGQFTFVYKNNINAGTATLEINCTGVNYTGTYVSNFTINTLSFTNASIETPYTYTGSGIVPVIKIGEYTMNGIPTITDYETLYYDGDESITDAPINAGNHKVTIKVVNSNIYCNSSRTATFKYVIERRNINDLDIHLDPKDVNSSNEIAWNGNDTKPGIIVPDALVEGRDYKVTYNDYSSVSTTTDAAITITGLGNYTGDKVLRYKITPRVLELSDEYTYEVTPSTNITPDYTLTVKLTDKNRQKGSQSLAVSTDYTIGEVKYYNDETAVWETLTSGSDYALSGSQITGLKRAGKYTVAIVGTNDYVGTIVNSATPVRCGKDISDYIPHIEDEELEHTYTGNSITPASIVLYKDRNTVDNTIPSTAYTVSYTRAEGGNDTKNVGKVYVIVTGDPTKGYYGKTSRLDVTRAYYTIISPIWSMTRPLTVEVVTHGGIYYEPYDLTEEPEVIVSYGGLTLKENRDYTLTYTDSKTAGKNKLITITGIGNYAYEKNTWTAKYDVLPVDISEANKQIDLTIGDADYANGETGFVIHYGKYKLVAGTDYFAGVQDVSGEAIFWNDAKQTYQTKYKITGNKNFTGEREVTIDVKKSNLSVEGGAEFADSETEAQSGQYYVVWSDEEMFVQDPDKNLNERSPLKPNKFTINYKSQTGKKITLTEGKDYKILDGAKDYGTNATPGYSENNYLTIQGMGGYTGTRKIYFTLYTDFSKVQLAPTSILQETSAATPVAISKTAWKEAYQASTETDKSKGLVKLLNLYTKEGGLIDPSEYKLEWPTQLNLADPAVGTYDMIIAGEPVKQDGSHYYKGNRTVHFMIVNSIESAQIQVNSNNCVQYTGQPATVTGAATTLSVTVDGASLTLGKDFEIVGYENNSYIGEAIVKIKGIGSYQGEAQGTFYITYPLAKMSVQMQDANNDWVDVTNGSNVSFQYNHEEKAPLVRLYIKAFDENAEKAFTEAGGYFETEYLNNLNAGTATVRIKNCKYFTSDSGYRDVMFTIMKTNICPPTQGAITYSPIAAVNGNLSVTYTGKDINATDDLHLVLADNGYTLEENKDYVLFPLNDSQNVSVAGSEPSFEVRGIGNYEGVYRFYYTITQKNINDGITATPLTVTFSGGTIKDAVETQLSLVQDDLQKTLVCGKDFEIEAYYMDQYGSGLVAGENGVPNQQGTYYAKVKGIGNYTGNRMVQIQVIQKDLSEGMTIKFISNEHCTLDAVGEPICVYDGKDHTPDIQVFYGSNFELKKNTDYTVSYVDNFNAGTATVTVTGIGNYTGTTSRTFTIQPKNIAQLDTSANTMYYSPLNESYPFTGSSVEPAMTIRDSETNATLVNPTDYTIDYTSEYNGQEIADGKPEHSYGGLVTMTITGQGNYTGTQEFTYYIGEDISRARALVNGNRSVSTTYNGLAQAPAENTITVEKDSTMTNLTDENYDIAYYKNGFDKTDMVTRDQIIDAATYYIAVIGVPSKGTYAKTSEQNSCAYTIYPRSVAPSYVLVSGYDGSYYYTGQPIEPKGITVEDTDLPVVNEPNDPQRRSVKLVNGTDYDISYVNNRSAGKASIIVTGKGNYTGSRAAYFNIVSSSVDGNNTWDGTSEGTGSITNGSTTISASDIILGYDNTTYNCMMYNGYERVPTVSINGMSNSDFIVTASNAIRPGVATLVIDGINNYQGRIYKNYTIKADLSQYGTVSTIADQSYTGYQITPYITLTCGGNLLTVGNDYTVTYANNTNVGRATVIATATANSYYVGTANGYFNISNTATGMGITGYASTYTYTGNAITPDVVVTMNGRMLNRGTDYIVTYSNNTNVGTATMTVTGIGSFSGTKTINYTIEAKNIENCITTAVTNYQYTGNTYTPSVTLTDSSTGKTLTAGTDYTITYSNNTNPGTASITVTALSRNYTGSKVISFKITSAAVSGLRASQIRNNSLKLSWSDQDYADGYQICNANNRVIGTTSNNSYTVKGLTSCTTYRYKVRSYVENADGSVSYGSFSTAISAKTMLNTPTLKARSTSRGKVTLTWSKVAKATGYEIYYSTEKNGIYTKLKTVSKSSARRYIDSGLASGEKYYYTIRAYRTVNGVKTYSSYNTIKSATVR